jgi:hypothetical protein
MPLLMAEIRNRSIFGLTLAAERNSLNSAISKQLLAQVFFI